MLRPKVDSNEAAVGTLSFVLLTRWTEAVRCTQRAAVKALLFPFLYCRPPAPLQPHKGLSTLPLSVSSVRKRDATRTRRKQILGTNGPVAAAPCYSKDATFQGLIRVILVFEHNQDAQARSYSRAGRRFQVSHRQLPIPSSCEHDHRTGAL